MKRKEITDNVIIMERIPELIADASSDPTKNTN